MRKTRTILALLCISLCLFSCVEELDEGASKAKEYLSGDHPEQALGYADSLLEEDPNNMDAVLVGAEALYEMGDYAQSIYYLGEYLQARSTSAEAFFLRAKNYRATGKVDQAYTDLEAAVKYDPDLHEAVEMLLTDYYNDYNWGAWLQRLWDLEKRGYKGGLFFGMCSVRALSQGNYEKAKEYAWQSIGEAPEKGMEYFLAKIYLEQGEPEAALKELEKAVINPMNGGSVSDLQGMAYLQLEDYEKLDQAAAALREEGRLAEASYLEGRKLIRQGDLEVARDSVERSEMNETHRSAMVQYIEAELGIGLFDSDHDYIESGNPFFIEALCFNAFWNLEADNASEAADIIEEAFKLNSEDVLTLYIRGLIKAKEGDVDGCDDLKKAKENKIGIIFGKNFEEEIDRLCD